MINDEQMKMGTPPTLKEAFRRAISIGTGKEIVGEGHLVIQDFLAQKFGAAMMKEKNQETLRALEELWKHIKDT